jgi:chromosome segregation protein
MRLKRLELFGFKSFADRMVLDFDAPVVGIVGPNGCGKSNVVDAMRWVLGETRPTSMRGGEMADVIFKGSASRPALNVAEVTLVLDNDDGDLAGRGPEVSLTRRVYRGGEGEYLIDGQVVRLRDVREMLYGTGLGSRGYSVLEQGKIDAILSANALERRAIFEEAAGISRYRARKKEAESRLERVRADCLRLDDVLAELDRRRRSLKLQAGKAQRYVEAKEGWLREGVRLARHQAQALAGRLEAAALRLGEAEAVSEALRERRTAAENEIAARASEQDAIQHEIAEHGGAAAEAAAELRGLDERRAQLLERAEASLRTSREEEARAMDLDGRLTQRREEAAGLEQAIAELEGAVEASGERARVLAGEVEALEIGLRELSAAHDTRSGAVLELLHARTTDQNHLQALERAQGLLRERIARVETRRAELDAQIERGRGEERERTAELDTVTAAHAGLESERGELLGHAQGLESQRSDLESRRNALEVEIARLSSRVESLRDWEEERSGLESGARELFRARDRGEEPARSAELTGLLADHLHPDSRHARALDAALGTRAQAVVMAAKEAALSIVTWLRERATGRVSLVLPTAWGATPYEHEVPAELAASEGYVGRLIGLARAEEAYQPLVRFLLDDALLVRDLESAVDLVARFPGWRFVTPEGDLVDAAGVSGGFQEVTHGPLGRRSTAAELEAERGREEAERDALDGQLDSLGRHQNETAERLRELGVELERTQERRARLASGLEALRARLEELGHARTLAASEHDERVEEAARIEAEHVETSARLVEVEERLASERAELEALEEARATREAERDRKKREESHARVEATGLAERLEGLRRERVQRQHAAEEAERELERTRRLAAEHARASAESRAVVEDLAVERETWQARRETLEQALGALREREREARRGLDEVRGSREGLTRELEAAVSAVGEERLERQRLELALEETLRRALEDFTLERDLLLGEFEPEPELAEAEALETLGREVRALKERLDQIGPVNLEAVGELDEVEQRSGFLGNQREDLEEARRTLEETVRRLNEESERKFLEAFEAIRDHFKLLFRQLFGGGKADIALAEGQPVLEAGIEITARPPGREALPITLLSGGQRTMTALAILFAVFRAQPSPFCVLDEVDAALDDANIGRFLGLLLETLDDTQFVVVTHNKGTMTACRMLYGVTMAVRGVSHVVSVELSEVDEIIPAPRREPAAASEGAGGGGATGSESELVRAES